MLLVCCEKKRKYLVLKLIPVEYILVFYDLQGKGMIDTYWLEGILGAPE